MEVLEQVEEKFINGCTQSGTSEDAAKELWEKLLKFANYGFNKSHSVAYSIITYICAWLKANYPVEFFCALMTIRSQTMSTKDWALKAPEYIQEAKNLNVKIYGPSIQRSMLGFSIVDGEIYFGLNAIRNVGSTAAQYIVKARQKVNFKDVYDFINRVNRQKVTTKVFEALVYAGAFDRMGYSRNELLEKTKDLYAYPTEYQDAILRKTEAEQRLLENQEKDKRRDEINALVKEAKTQLRDDKKAGVPPKQSTLFWASYQTALKEIRELVKEAESAGRTAADVLNSDQLTLYEETIWLRKKPELKLKDVPDRPELTKSTTLTLSIDELIIQADYIGCYLGTNPARLIFTDAVPICSVEEDDYTVISGIVIKIHEITTRRGDQMAFLNISDGTSIAEIIVFPKQFARFKKSEIWPNEKDVVQIIGRVENIDPIKLIADQMDIYRRPE